MRNGSTRSQEQWMAAQREVEAVAVAHGSLPAAEPTELVLRVQCRDPQRARELLESLLGLVHAREGETWRGERWNLLEAGVAPLRWDDGTGRSNGEVP